MGNLQFRKLKELFIVEVNKKKIPIAFIEVFNIVPGPSCELDCELGLCRLHINRNQDHDTMFIHVQSIIRGALISREHASVDTVLKDYLVIDTVDSDMFLRCRRNFPIWDT